MCRLGKARSGCADEQKSKATTLTTRRRSTSLGYRTRRSLGGRGITLVCGFAGCLSHREIFNMSRDADPLSVMLDAYR